jgi:hypothetical protein
MALSVPTRAAIDPGEPQDGVVDLLLYAGDGTLMIDPEGQTLDGYVLRSAAGMFDGESANHPGGWFTEDTDGSISCNMGFTLSEVYDLGAVIGPDWIIVDPYAKVDVNPYDDITFTYTLVDQPGTYYGNLIVMPYSSKCPAADFSGNGCWGLEDLAILAQYWLTNEPLVDIAPSPDGDGVANFRDFARFAACVRKCQSTLVMFADAYSVSAGGSKVIETSAFRPTSGCLCGVRITVWTSGLILKAKFDNESDAASGIFSAGASLKLQRGAIDLLGFELSRIQKAIIGADDELDPRAGPDFMGGDTLELTKGLMKDSISEMFGPDGFVGTGTVSLQLTYEVEASTSLSRVASRIDSTDPAEGALLIEYIYSR